MGAMKDMLQDYCEQIEREYKQDYFAVWDYIVENPIQDEKLVFRNAKTAAKYNLLYKRGYIRLKENKEDYPYALDLLTDLGYTLLERKRNFTRFGLAGQEIIVERVQK